MARHNVDDVTVRPTNFHLSMSPQGGLVLAGLMATFLGGCWTAWAWAIGDPNDPFARMWGKCGPPILAVGAVLVLTGLLIFGFS